SGRGRRPQAPLQRVASSGAPSRMVTNPTYSCLKQSRRRVDSPEMSSKAPRLPHLRMSSNESTPARTLWSRRRGAGGTFDDTEEGGHQADGQALRQGHQEGQGLDARRVV